VSYVLGAHNSASFINDTLEAIAKRLRDVPAEIVVVENGSSDDTLAVLQATAKTWPSDAPRLRVMSSDRGLGIALRTGLAATTGEIVVVTSDDLCFNFDEFDASEKLSMREVGVVIGSKAHRDSVVRRNLLRDVLSGGLRVLRILTLGMTTGDPQGTYVLYGPWIRAVTPALREPGFLVTTEIAYLALLSGIKPLEVAVTLREGDHRTRIKLSDPIRMALGLVATRARKRALRKVARASVSASEGGSRPVLPSRVG
jgi:glycosyltransferase involved in cell wall biosynthesis